MATDVALALLSAIQTDFQRRVADDSVVKRMSNRIRDGTAKLEEVHDYAARLGELLSQSLLAVFTEDALPDRRLYWNIADRTIRPMLKDNHAAVNAAAKAVQKVLDAAAGIGLNTLPGEFDEERVDRLIGAATQTDTFAQMQAAITEPVINCTESFFDDFVQTNADFRYQAGMSPKIVRTVAANCCEWCADLAGTYDYPLDNSDVYRRHQFCRCVVTFESGKLRQDVHSKRWYNDSGMSLANKHVDLDVLRRTPEEARLLDQALAEEAKRIAKQQRENAVAAYQQMYNVSHRRAANRLTRAAQR